MRVRQDVFAAEDRIAGGFADVDAVTSPVEGPALLRRHELQGVEAVKDAHAEAVHAADQHGIDDTLAEPASGRGEYLGAR